MAVTPQQGTDLMNFFAKHSTAPKFNRATSKWAARELIESYGVDKCREAVLWYVKVSPKQEWGHFVRICGDCIMQSELAVADNRLRREHRRTANQWRSN